MNNKLPDFLLNKLNNQYGEDITNILHSVQEMLEYMADDTKEKYPYATNSIDGYNQAAYTVFSLISELD